MFKLPQQFFKSKEWKLLWPFYVFVFLLGAIAVSMPFHVIYYLGKGLLLTQVAMLWAAMAITRLFAEVPTGVVADVLGRRVSSLISFFMMGACWVLVPAVVGFYPILIGLMILLAVSQTLGSGAYDGWIYDFLKQKKQKNLIKNYYARSSLFLHSGLIIGGVLGGVLAAFFSLGWLFVIDGLGSIAAAFVLVFFTKEHFFRAKCKGLKAHFLKAKQTLKQGLKFVSSTKSFILLTIASMAFLGWISIAELARQPFLKELGMPIHYLGYFFAVLFLFTALAPTFGVWLSRRISEKTIFLGSAVLILVFSLAIYTTKNPYFLAGAILLMAMDIAFFIQRPIFDSRVQHIIPSPIRVTVLSTQGMFGEIITVIVLLAGGILMDAIGPKLGIVLAGLFMIPAFIAFAFLGKNSKKQKK